MEAYLLPNLQRSEDHGSGWLPTLPVRLLVGSMYDLRWEGHKSDTYYGDAGLR